MSPPATTELVTICAEGLDCAMTMSGPAFPESLPLAIAGAVVAAAAWLWHEARPRPRSVPVEARRRRRHQRRMP